MTKYTLLRFRFLLPSGDIKYIEAFSEHSARKHVHLDAKLLSVYIV